MESDLGIIQTEPVFVGGTPFDYHIHWSSPSIDTGDPDLNGDGCYWDGSYCEGFIPDEEDQDPDGTRMDMGAFYFHHQAGDINGDADINVIDVTLLSEIIINEEVLTGYFIFDYADVNDDSIIDVIDIVLIVNCIMADDCETALQRSEGSQGHGRLFSTLDDQNLNKSDGLTQIISMESNMPVKGFQFELNYNIEEYDFSHIELTEASSGFELRYVDDGIGQIKLVAYSIDSFEIPAGEIEVLLVYLDGLAKNTEIPTLNIINPVIADKNGNALILGTEEQNIELPIQFTLHPAYPNPFNPETTIEYDLPKDSNVSLIIYDVMGREVANLVNDNQIMQAGYHSIVWNASGYSSRIYFVKLIIPEYTETQKLMLLK